MGPIVVTIISSTKLSKYYKVRYLVCIPYIIKKTLSLLKNKQCLSISLVGTHIEKYELKVTSCC